MIDVDRFEAVAAASPTGQVALGPKAIEDIVTDLRAGEAARRELAAMRRRCGKPA